MTVTHGMDTVAGRQAGERIREGSDEIVELAQRLDAVIMGLDWTGTDADRVRGSWQDHERPALDRTAQHLSALAVLLAAEAMAQDAASDTDGGTAPDSAVGGTGVASATVPGGPLGWLSRHPGAYAAGLLHAGEDASDFAGKLGDVLTGQRDWSVAALAASALSSSRCSAPASRPALRSCWSATTRAASSRRRWPPTRPSCSFRRHPRAHLRCADRPHRDRPVGPGPAGTARHGRRPPASAG